MEEKLKVNDSHKTFKIFINEIYSKGQRQNYIINKTTVLHTGDICSLDILDLKGYGPEINRKNRYVLVVIDNFSKFVWTIPLKNKDAQTKKRLFRKNSYDFKNRPNLIESDRVKEIYNNTFEKILNQIRTLNNIPETHT